MPFGFKELLIVLFIVFVIFGAGKLPSVMKNLGKGVRSLRQGMEGKEDDNRENNNNV